MGNPTVVAGGGGGSITYYILDGFENGRRIKAPAESGELKYLFNLYLGGGTVSVDSVNKTEGANSLSWTYTSGTEMQFQFAPYPESLSGWPTQSTFLTDFVNNPNMIAGGNSPAVPTQTLNRMVWRFLVPTVGLGDNGGAADVEFGTYCMAEPRGDPYAPFEDYNWHFYHKYNFESSGLWETVILDTQPDHQRGDNGDFEQDDNANIDGTNTYFDRLTRFYIHTPYILPSYISGGGPFKIDDFKLYATPYNENIKYTRALHGFANGADNKVHVGWTTKKDSNSTFDVRYSFTSFYASNVNGNFSLGTAAPSGTGIARPNINGYNAVKYESTSISLVGQTEIFIAIRAVGQTLFREIRLPIQNVVSGAVTKLLTISGSTDSTHKKWNLATSYLGAFRMPNATYGSLPGNQASVNYDARPVIGLTSSTKFVIGGGSNGDTFKSIGEYNIPALSTSATLTSLNTATNSKNFVDPFSAAPNEGSNWGVAPQLGGICAYNGRLMVNYFAFYDGSNLADRSLLVMNDVTTLSTASERGTFAVLANPNTSHASGWISPIPAAYQSSFGGTHIFGQSSSNMRSIESRFPIGPSAVVYNADASNSVTGSSPVADASTLTTTTVLDYSLAHMVNLSGDLSASGTNWTHISSAQYGFIVPGTKTYCVMGLSGGHNTGVTYVDAPSWGGYKGYWPNDAGDPGGGSDMYNYYWLFNVDDMLAVKAGTIAAYTPQPYEHGILPMSTWGDGLGIYVSYIAGATFDATNNKLYMSLFYGDDSVSGGLPLIVCYDMS